MRNRYAPQFHFSYIYLIDAALCFNLLLYDCFKRICITSKIFQEAIPVYFLYECPIIARFHHKLYHILGCIYRYPSLQIGASKWSLAADKASLKHVPKEICSLLVLIAYRDHNWKTLKQLCIIVYDN